MRLVAWNCNMALHRKVDALLALRPDIAVVSEAPSRLDCVRNAETVFNPSRCGSATTPQRAWPCWRSLVGGWRWRMATALAFATSRRPQCTGPRLSNCCGLGSECKRRDYAEAPAGPLRLALNRYRQFPTDGPSVVAGDWNSNSDLTRPGWRNNHMTKVRLLSEMGLASAYHHLRRKAHGQETIPTLYWRERREDGPHLPYRLRVLAVGMVGECDALRGRTVRRQVRQRPERPRANSLDLDL
jgi:exodeoxyribonuclease III